MVKSCAIKNCKITWTRNSKISFHNFPLKNPDLLAKWLEKIPPELINTPTSHTYICSGHFLPECYQPQAHNSKNYLRKNAIPTVFDDSMMMESTEPMVEETVSQSANPTIVEKSSVSEEGNSICEEEDNQSNVMITNVDEKSITDLMLESDEDNSEDESFFNTGTPTSSEHLELSNREMRLMKKVKVLQRRLRRREKKFELIEQSIKALKARMLRDQKMNSNVT